MERARRQVEGIKDRDSGIGSNVAIRITRQAQIGKTIVRSNRFVGTRTEGLKGDGRHRRIKDNIGGRFEAINGRANCCKITARVRTGESGVKGAHFAAISIASSSQGALHSPGRSGLTTSMAARRGE